MRTRTFFHIALAAAAVLIFLSTAAASALELETGGIRGFDDNRLTVTCEAGGKLTVEAASGTVPLENPVTGLEIPAGTTEIPWAGLTYGGEPLTPGSLTLRATLERQDGQTEQAEIRVRVGNPRSAVTACLPGARTFYANGRDTLRIECALSAPGRCEVSIARKDRPEEEIWHTRKEANGKAPLVIFWNGIGRDHKVCAPGDYVISAYTTGRSGFVQTAEVTLPEEPLPEPEMTVTGSLIPEDLADDAAVWAALTAPVAVGDGPEGKGLYIMDGRDRNSRRIGNTVCRTVGIAILEIYPDGWVKVGAWRQSDGLYTEGYMLRKQLRMVRPNTRYGAVLDKKAQTLTVYGDGEKLGTVRVSTGMIDGDDRKADTHSGVFLFGTRLSNFENHGHTYCYPVRLESLNLIHQAGYAMHDGERDFEEEIAALGTMSSHGCIRVDPRTTEENAGINSWWIWTHLGHDTKIIITPEE